ncbi:MAG: hypothetical protein J2P36_24195 [Ktedonobacteraceae bacterium]|nr:hypothetical protein [Ktedonobacteraceae bacterium]
MRNALATRADNEYAVHEKGSEATEQRQGDRGVLYACQRVGNARVLDRPDDAVDGSSHANVRALSRMEENTDPTRLLGIAATPLALLA